MIIPYLHHELFALSPRIKTTTHTIEGIGPVVVIDGFYAYPNDIQSMLESAWVPNYHMNKKSANFKDYYDRAPPIKNIVATKEHPVEGNSYVTEVINMFLARALGITLNTGKLTDHLFYLENDAHLLFGGNMGTSIDVAASRSTFRFTVSDYLVNVVNRYTKKGKFMRDDYVREVFIKNADIWGALVSLVSYISPMATGLTATQRATTTELLRKYIFSSEYATKPIPPKAVCLELREIAASIMKPLSAKQVSRELPKPWIGMLHEELGSSVGRKSSKDRKTKKQKRCPNGTRRNKRTGDCEPIDS